VGVVRARTQAESGTDGSQSYSRCVPGRPGVLYKQIIGHSISSWREQNV